MKHTHVSSLLLWYSPIFTFFKQVFAQIENMTLNVVALGKELSCIVSVICMQQAANTMQLSQEEGLREMRELRSHMGNNSPKQTHLNRSSSLSSKTGKRYRQISKKQARWRIIIHSNEAKFVCNKYHHNSNHSYQWGNLRDNWKLNMTKHFYLDKQWWKHFVQIQL